LFYRFFFGKSEGRISFLEVLPKANDVHVGIVCSAVLSGGERPTTLRRDVRDAFASGGRTG
jgi:hypothetical protein